MFLRILSVWLDVRKIWQPLFVFVMIPAYKYILSLNLAINENVSRIYRYTYPTMHQSHIPQYTVL